MAIDVKRRAPDTSRDELELLWELPTNAPRRPTPPERPTAPAVGTRLIEVLRFGWPAVLASIVLFHPASSPEAQEWAYAGWASAGLLVALAIGYIALLFGRDRSALTASTVAGAVGLLLAWECRAAAQHYGNWWAYELVAFGALTAVSVAAAVRYLARS